MGYKVLGYLVWQVAKLYLRRRYPAAKRKLAIAAAVGGAIVGGALVARAVRSDDG